MSFEKLVAALTLVVCVVLLVRLMLGERRRYRFDAAARRAWFACRTVARRAVRWPTARKEAAAAAEDAIRRARGTVDRDGNVIRPRAFRGPRKPH
jgi:hypothetical protein